MTQSLSLAQLLSALRLAPSALKRASIMGETTCLLADNESATQKVWCSCQVEDRTLKDDKWITL